MLTLSEQATPTASPLHRIAVMPLLLMFTLIASASQTRVRRPRRREAWEPFAQSMGAQVIDAPTTLDHFGSEGARLSRGVAAGQA